MPWAYMPGPPGTTTRCISTLTVPVNCSDLNGTSKTSTTEFQPGFQPAMQNDTIPQTTQILWTPGTEQLQSSRLVQYQRWLSEEKGIVARDYAELWRWSVDDLEGFWQSIWDFFEIHADGV